ncbi:hypothetical protein [Streptomyces sp. NPDC001880]
MAFFASRAPSRSDNRPPCGLRLVVYAGAGNKEFVRARAASALPLHGAARVHRRLAEGGILGRLLLVP